MCFADYLCDTGKELFTDKIYAFKYGPVVDTVYKRYREYGYKPIEQETEDIDSKNIFEMPAKSRIIFAEEGTEKILRIDILRYFVTRWLLVSPNIQEKLQMVKVLLLMKMVISVNEIIPFSK